MKVAAEADRAAAEMADERAARRRENGDGGGGGGAGSPDPPHLRPIQIPEEGEGELDDMVRWVLCCFLSWPW